MELSVIQNKIYEIRGYKVMLDFDLAAIYGIENKYLKRAVRHNIERFEGEDFMFELTQKEVDSLRCNFSTLNTGSRGQHTKYLPFAFTELGVAMLSSVLNSKTAIDTNRNIMRAFVMFRHYATGLVEVNKKLEDFMIETNMQFNEIYQVLTELAEKKKELEQPLNPVGYLSTRKRNDKNK